MYALVANCRVIISNWERQEGWQTGLADADAVCGGRNQDGLATRSGFLPVEGSLGNTQDGWGPVGETRVLLGNR